MFNRIRRIENSGILQRLEQMHQVHDLCEDIGSREVHTITREEVSGLIMIFAAGLTAGTWSQIVHFKALF